MIHFTVRDLLWLNAAAGLALGWWLDRSALDWRYRQTLTAAAHLRERLEQGHSAGQPVGSGAAVKGAFASPAAGYSVGIALFAVAVIIVLLVWRGTLHPSVLSRRS